MRNRVGDLPSARRGEGGRSSGAAASSSSGRHGHVAARAGSELRISRDDAIQLALENNLNLIIARTGPELAQQQVERAGGAFDPQLYLDHEFAQNENPVFSPFQILFGGGQTSIDDKQWFYSGGFAGLVPAGVTYSSAYNVSRVETSSAFSALTPEWRGDWESELRIPVLKNLSVIPPPSPSSEA